MNATQHILSRQIEWARNRNIELTGSHGARGLEVYTRSIEANLFQPLNEQTRSELGAGEGGDPGAKHRQEIEAFSAMCS